MDIFDTPEINAEINRIIADAEGQHQSTDLDTLSHDLLLQSESTFPPLGLGFKPKK